MNVYKLTLCFVDHDNLGDKHVRDLFDNLHLPNHIIGPDVMKMESVDIGEWKDSNPLNFSDRISAEFERLFPEEKS